jgi:hypothetical protein
MSKKPKPEGLFPVGYWDRPPDVTQGDSDASQIFSAVGATLSAWEHAEYALSALSVVFSKVEDHSNGAAALRVLFGSRESSAGRRSALAQLSELYFGNGDSDPELKSKFTKLMEAFSSASRRRDDIAHGCVMTVTSDNPNVGNGIYFVPSIYNSNRNSPFLTEGDFWFMRGKYRYSSKSIFIIHDKFVQLTKVTFQYLSSLSKTIQP